MKGRWPNQLLKSAYIAVVTASTLVLLAANANAQIVLPGTVLDTQASVQANGVGESGLPPRQVTDPPSCDPTNLAACQNAAFASASINPGLSLSTDPVITVGSITTGTSNFNQAIASLTYFFRADGPSNTDVHLRLLGSITST
jgi:hypothetical protein